MRWNWQLQDFPHFTYDLHEIHAKEKKFLLLSGSSMAFLKNIDEEGRNLFIIEILSIEGVETSKIEGEILARESLQSSIKKHFGLKSEVKQGKKEKGMAELLCDVYETFEQPLTHEMLWKWHFLLFQESASLEDKGTYRTHESPMQIISSRLDAHTVFFEAPPSEIVFNEMTRFVDWFNASYSEPILARAALCHLYFESIHPFEDGNGRIGRVLVEKIISQAIGKPVLLSLSKMIEKQRKTYYAELGKCNRSLEASSWVNFFADVIMEAKKDSMKLLCFLREKSNMLTRLKDQINERQEKVLLRMFAEGPKGFQGGLSAENYLAITKTSRATATRDLAELVQKEALIKRGELRHTRYFLNVPK